jgi:nicotinamidase/pyrazinamidase
MTVMTGDQHPAITPHCADYGGIWPTHCVASAEGAQLHPALTIDVCVASNAIRAVNLQPEDGAKAIKEMHDAGMRMVTTGATLTTQEIQAKPGLRYVLIYS